MAAESFIKPVSTLADFGSSAFDQPSSFRFGASAATSVLARPTLDHVDSPPGWQAVALDQAFSNALAEALDEAAGLGDTLLDGWRQQIKPLEHAEIPSSLLNALPAFSDELLEHQPFDPIYKPLRTAWVPLPPPHLRMTAAVRVNPPRIAQS